MRIGWLADEHDPPGGAELTQAEFRAAAPDGVEVVDCPPGGVVEGLGRYVVHNHLTYSTEDVAAMEDRAADIFRYHHDLRPQAVGLAQHIFCSPIQMERWGEMASEWPCIPPALDLKRFRPTRQIRRNGKRKGTICVGAMLNPGKGAHLLAEWAKANGGIDFYGYGPYAPSESAYVAHLGPQEQDALPQLLWKYDTFVYLPTALEPFGRAVVEAWAAGCKIITNNLVGARYWIEEAPEKLETAAKDFWSCVLDS